MPNPINIPFDEFLRPLFDSNETVNIRIFDDKKSAGSPCGSTFSGLKLECEQGKLPGIEGTLRKHNAQGRGIFFVVNFGGDCDEDISRINAVFVENDNLSIEAQLAALEAFPLPPSLMVKTAKSVHAYWLVRDVPGEKFRSFQKRLVAQFEGDPACVNESRVLRLPGFNHCKGEPVMVECIKFAPELRYTAAQLDEVLPRIAEESSVVAPAPKSTLLSIAQEILLGSENVSNIPWQALSERFNKAELFGKLANIFADLPSKNIDDGGMFKALTGEDYITGERKNKDPFNFRPYARLLFSCNDIPKNYSDRSDGFYRRLLIIRFDNSVPKAKRDPNLRERIASERDGILLWALDGLIRLINNSYQFGETERTRSELHRYKVESNSALMFLGECCEVADGAECVREQLFERYRDYCIKNGLKPMSQGNFNKDVEGSDPLIRKAKDKVGKRHTWRGLRLCDA
jgi:P4 family phage/plasmid primase-like protien